MDANTISQLVGAIGVPAALCFIMAYIIYKMNNQHEAEMSSLRSEMAANNMKMQEALNNNTLAIQHLTDMITKKEVK